MAKPKLDIFHDCCGTCRYSHMNEFKNLTCWVNPPVFAGHVDEANEPVFYRGLAEIKAIDPACHRYSNKNPQ